MPSWKKLLVHGGSGSLAHLKLENLTSQNVLGTDAQGNIVAGSVSGYTLPIATDSILGGIKVGGTLIISNGVLSARTYVGAVAAVPGEGSGVAGVAGYVPSATAGQSAYFLRGDGTWAVPTNTVTRLRSSAGTNYLSGDLMITGSGATSVSVAGSTFTISTTLPTPYSLPIATASTLGGIKIGSGLTIDRDTGVVTAAAGTSLSADRTTFYSGSLSLNGAGATTVTYVPQLGGFVISSTDTDTNTTYSAGTGLTLSDTTFSVTANTYAAANHTHDDRYLKLTDTGSFFDRIIDSAPGTLDTLNELAAAIGDDANFSASIAGILARKSETGHTHDDRYYTETEVNAFLAGKAAATHSHDYDNYQYWTVADRTASTRLESTNTLTVLGSGGASVTLDAATNTLTISSTDNDTTYAQATSSTLGLVKIGYTANAKNYPVALDGTGKMYVNVPWTDTDTNTITSVGVPDDLSTGNIEFRGAGATTITKSGGTITISSTDTDTNTTYSAGTGLTLTGTTFSVTAGTYAAASHTHTIRDIESLEDELNGKQAAGSYLTSLPSHNHDDRYYTETESRQLFGAFGRSTLHSAYSSFDTSPDFGGWSYVIGNTSSPHNGSQGGYRLRVGLGADYSIDTSPGAYAMELNIPRSSQGGTGNGYLFMRQMESGNWGSWSKISAGYADSAGAVAWTNVSGRPTAVSSFTNDAGYITSYTDTNTITSVGVSGDLSTGDIVIRGGGATTVTKSGGTITITSTDTDTNTTYSAGTGLTLSGTTFSVTAGTYAAASHTHAISNVTGLQDALNGKLSTSGTAANSSQLEGISAYGMVEESRGVHSSSDFVDGTLVMTDIPATSWAGNSFVMEVSGKSYDSGNSPFKLTMQGYLYADTIINVSAMSYGSYFPGPVKVMEYDSYVAFWWPRGSYWNSFQVHVRNADGDSWNRVTAVRNSAEPDGRKKISCTPIQVIHTNNIGSQSVNYATTAGTANAVAWGNVSGRPSNLSEFTNNLTSFPNRIEFQYSADRYSQAWRNSSTGAYWWVTTDDDKLGFHRNGDGDKFYFGNGGDFWSSTNGWLSTALAAKQNANTAINTGNISSQTVASSGNSNHLNSTRDTPSNSLQYWQAPGLGIDEAPSGDWHNTIRMGHGSPLSYYSNTLAVRMTGTGVGDIYTQTIMNGTRQGWKKHWNDGNDGAGSGLDADLLDGNHASAFAAASHGHAIREVEGLEDALNGKQAAGSYLTSLPSHNHDDRYYTESESDDRFLRIAANSSSPTNATFAIGTASDRNFIQSHSGRPLDINPLGNTVTIGGSTAIHAGNYSSYALPLSGGTLTGQLHASGVSSGVSLHVGNGSDHGVYTLDNARKQLVVSADYYPHMVLAATGANNTNHGAVFSLVGSEGGSARQWNIGIPNNNPFVFSIGYNATGDNNPHYGVGDDWSATDAYHARLSIDRSGNTKIRGMLYVNGTRGGITTGNAVIHTGGGQTIGGITYFSNGESLNLYGIRGRFTNEYIHLYEKVGIGHPSGWGQGEGNTPTQGFSTYGGINIAYGRDNGATINTYTRINKNWAGGDYSAEQFTIRGTYPSITLRSTQHDNVWLIHNDDTVSFYYGRGVDSNDWGRKLYIPTNGDIWMSWANANISTLLDGKAAASHTHDDRYYTESESISLFARRDTSTNINGNLVLGNTAYNQSNAYSNWGSRLFFNGSDSDAQSNYYIGTNPEDVGGNYSKLDLRWHTGIRMGAQPSYGGMRFYDSEDLGTVLFSVGFRDTHVRVTNNLYIGDNLAIHAGNYSSYALPLSGGTVTGETSFTKSTYPVFIYSYGNTAAVSAQGLQVYSSGGNGAIMAFHRGGQYAVNMGLDSDNIIRIGGWSAAANRMQLDMSGNVTFAGNVTGYSDARIKTDVKTIDNALDKVKNLRGVSFRRTDSDDRSTNIGVIAQEVLEVLPEVVSQDASGMYNVAYGNMAGLFIEAIKQQQSLIEQQQKQIDELKALVNGLTK